MVSVKQTQALLSYAHCNEVQRHEDLAVKIIIAVILEGLITLRCILGATCSALWKSINNVKFASYNNGANIMCAKKREACVPLT